MITPGSSGLKALVYTSGNGSQAVWLPLKNRYKKKKGVHGRAISGHSPIWALHTHGHLPIWTLTHMGYSPIWTFTHMGQTRQEVKRPKKQVFFLDFSLVSRHDINYFEAQNLKRSSGPLLG